MPDDPPSTYPARWEGDVVLSDGGTVHVRPIRPDDSDALVAFHNRQSAESVYFRFFSSHPRLSDREVAFFTQVDHRDRMAFVAFLGDELVAVARYEPTGRPGSAEVAFFVDDRHHGRGLATLLLEYLVVAAREAGYSTLTATVLPANSAMLTTFRKAGFHTTSSWSEGLVDVSIDLQPSEREVAAIAERERRSDARSVARLLHPTSVAVIGASRDPAGLGHRVVNNLLAGGFQGPVFPVNEGADHVNSVLAYRDVAELPVRVDLAVIAVPAERLDEVVEQCARNGVGGMVVATAGVDGAALATRARRLGMRVVGPASLGMINDAANLSLWAVVGPPPAELQGLRMPGASQGSRAALAVQSSAVGAAVLDLAAQADLPLSAFVSLGLKGDVSGNDLLQYWDEDPTTGVVLLYLESHGNPRRFFRIARRVSRRKPIVAVSTAGWSEGAGALGGRSNLFSALLAQAGVMEAATLGELLDVGRLLACQPLPAGHRLAVVSNSASPATLAAAAARRSGLEVVDEVSLEETAGPLDFQEALTLVLGRTGIDAAAVLYAPLYRQELDDVAEAIATAASRAGRTVVATYLGRRQPPPSAVPAYRFPEEGVRALAVAARYANWRNAHTAPDVHAHDEAAQAALAAVRQVVAEVLAEHPSGAVLDGEDGARLLAAAGVPVAPQRWVTSVEGAVAAAEELGWPVALKAGERPPVARTEGTGLALDLDDGSELAGAWGRMSAALGPQALARALVQCMAPPGIDARVLALADPHLGPVVALGRGGVAGSRPEELAVRLAPLDPGDAGRLVDASPLPVEALPEVGRSELEDLADRVGRLVAELPELAEVRLDPVLVSDGGSMVTDLYIRVAPAPPPALPEVRRAD